MKTASWPAHDGRKDSPPITPDERSRTTLAALREMRQRHDEVWVKKLEAQVRALNQAVGHDAVFIVPASDAVFALRERIAEGKAPGLKAQAELFQDSLGHATPPLALLVTYCQFAAIYQRSPVGLPVHSSIKTLPQAAELNTLLQQLAWEAVSKYPMSGVKTVKP